MRLRGKGNLTKITQLRSRIEKAVFSGPECAPSATEACSQKCNRLGVDMGTVGSRGIGGKTAGLPSSKVL